MAPESDDSRDRAETPNSAEQGGDFSATHALPSRTYSRILRPGLGLVLSVSIARLEREFS